MGRQEVIGVGMIFLGWGWSAYAIRESMYLAGALFMILGTFVILDGLFLSRLLVLGWVRLGALFVMMGFLRDWRQFPLTGNGPYDLLPELALYGLGIVVIVGGILAYWFTHDVSVVDLKQLIKQKLTPEAASDEFGRSLGAALGICLVLFAMFVTSVYFDWGMLAEPKGREQLGFISILVAVIFLMLVAASLTESLKEKNLPFSMLGGFLFFWGFSFLVSPIGDISRAILFIVIAIMVARFSDGLESILYVEEEEIFDLPSLLPQSYPTRTERLLKAGFILVGLFLNLLGVLFIAKPTIISSLTQNVIFLAVLAFGVLLHLYLRVKKTNLDHPLITAMTMSLIGSGIFFGLRILIELLNVILGLFGSDPRGASIVGLGIPIAAIFLIISGMMFLNHTHNTCSMHEKTFILGIPLGLLGLVDLIISPIDLGSMSIPVAFHSLTISGGNLGGYHLLEGIALVLAAVILILHDKIKSKLKTMSLVNLISLLPVLVYGISLVAAFTLPSAISDVVPYSIWWNRGIQVSVIAGILLILFFVITFVEYYLKTQRGTLVSAETTA